MAFDFENAAPGAGVGIVSALMAWFNQNKRLDQMQKDIDAKAGKEACSASHGSIASQFQAINTKLDLLIEHSMKRRTGD